MLLLTAMPFSGKTNSTATAVGPAAPTNNAANHCVLPFQRRINHHTGSPQTPPQKANEITLGMVNGGTAVIFQGAPPRSEEHTSELQSRPHLVCRLLLEKKK